MTRLGVAVCSAACALTWSTVAQAQNRGVYPLGMSAVNSGITPEPGFNYSNQLLFYSRGSAKDESGATLATGSNAVVMDMNSFTWVSRTTLPGGARYSATATLPFAKNQLTSDLHGNLSGGGGFADSYYLPLILGWTEERASVRVLYGFLAPTGRFAADAADNVGSGYWTSTLSSGQTLYLTNDKTFAVSVFEMYEFHTAQETTATGPGDTFDLDYSAMRTFRLSQGSSRLQLGVVGYEQHQTTAKTGPEIAAAESQERYGVNAIGFASTAVFPDRRLTVGVRYFEEFANRSTFQGFSLQFSGAIGF